MQYVISFLEGVISFISPCLLPMLPIYVLYFSGGELEGNKYKALKNSIGFVLGFSAVFVLLGAFAGTLGRLLNEYKTLVNIVTGGIVIFFGLKFLGVIKLKFLDKTFQTKQVTNELGFFSSILFGMIFSVGWTPCVGAFLGSALMMASQGKSAVQGIIMLLAFSLGLGIPFIISALLIDKIKGAFDFIKRNYTVINKVSGSLLIVIGILMVTGYIDYIFSAFSI